MFLGQPGEMHLSLLITRLFKMTRFAEDTTDGTKRTGSLCLEACPDRIPPDIGQREKERSHHWSIELLGQRQV